MYKFTCSCCNATYYGESGGGGGGCKWFYINLFTLFVMYFLQSNALRNLQSSFQKRLELTKVIVCCPPFNNKRILIYIYELVAETIINCNRRTINRYTFLNLMISRNKNSDHYSCCLYIYETWCANCIMTKSVIRLFVYSYTVYCPFVTWGTGIFYECPKSHCITR